MPWGLALANIFRLILESQEQKSLSQPPNTPDRTKVLCLPCLPSMRPLDATSIQPHVTCPWYEGEPAGTNDVKLGPGPYYPRDQMLPLWQKETPAH